MDANRTSARPRGLIALGAIAILGPLAGCGSIAAPGAGHTASERAGASTSGPASQSAAPGTAPQSAGTPSTAAQSAAVAGSGTCPSSALKVSLDSSAAGVAAGSSLVPLQFENISASSCTLPDYPAVSFASGSNGPDIGAPASHEHHSATARTLALAPGQVAHAWLQIVAAANYPASSCKPVTAHGLRISLASATTSYVAQAIPACAQSPAGSSVLTIYPVRPGQARRGTAP